MSEIRVDNVKNEAGTGAPTFPNGAIIVGNVGSTSLNITGISTLGNTVVGGGTTQLIVTGDARITGILTIGTSSITLDGSNNQVNVGTGVTLHHTNGVQVGGNNLHSTVLTVNQINASGVITATSFSGALTGNATGLSGTPNITVGNIIASSATISGNVSVAGTVTYEDVTNVDSIGIITARTGIVVTAGGINASGVITATSFSGDGTNLTNTGSTLSAASGSQRVVLTGQTSGTMTASATDSALTFAQSTGTLSATKFSGDGSGLTNVSPFNWSIKTGNYTATAKDGLFINTSSGAITVTLPASPTTGDYIHFLDLNGTFATNNLTIARNSNNIIGVATDLVVDINNSGLTLVYTNATNGWKLMHF